MNFKDPKIVGIFLILIGLVFIIISFSGGSQLYLIGGVVVGGLGIYNIVVSKKNRKK